MLEIATHASSTEQCSNNHDNDLLTRYLKLAPTEFSGTAPDPYVAENWVQNAECILKRVVGTTFDWVNISTFKLQGEARDWRESAELTESEPITWKRVKELFFQELISDVSRDRNHSEFMNMEQGHMSLTEFSNNYISLSRYAPEVTSNDE
ncbi:hypothetical protein MKX03_030909, partial [Papaver bracteatum]